MNVTNHAWIPLVQQNLCPQYIFFRSIYFFVHACLVAFTVNTTFFVIEKHIQILQELETLLSRFECIYSAISIHTAVSQDQHLLVLTFTLIYTLVSFTRTSSCTWFDVFRIFATFVCMIRFFCMYEYAWMNRNINRNYHYLISQFTEE